jgi:imidazolonepropionase-like amidohydrolase
MMYKMYRKYVWAAAVGVCCVAVAASGCVTTSSNEKEKPPEVEPSDVDWPPDETARNLAPVQSEPETVLIKDAVVMTAVGRTFDPGYLLLEDGEIAQVSGESIEAPADAEVVDADGRYVTPGLIDTHSHIGVYPAPTVTGHFDGNESTSPNRAEVDGQDSVWPQDPGFGKALAGGVTALQILPGSANNFGGRTVTLEMHPGISARAMHFDGAPDGLKMACGENPKRVYGGRGQMPSTRMGTAAVFRQAFQNAVETRRKYEKYRKTLAEWKSKPEDEREDRPTPPSRNFGTETLIDVLNGEALVHLHCYRADDMIRMLEIADQFGFEIRSFHHATQSYKIRDLLAKWDVAVSIWVDWWGFKMEAHDAIPHNAGLTERAGGRPIIHSDSHTGIQRLNQNAARAMWEARHAGLEVTRNEALRWVTANAAWALGIHEQTGTLEKGKRADVVLWSGDPFSVYSKADKVWVEGVREFDRSRDQQPWSDFEVGTQVGSGFKSGPENTENQESTNQEDSE